MSTWSTLRRFTQPHHLQLRRHSSSSPPPPPSSSSTTTYSETTFLKWVSGIFATSALGIAIHNSDNFPALSFAETENNVVLSSTDHAPPKKPKFLFREAYRRKVFFNYEKRIRMRSPPEKVFEYFASFRGNHGEVLMTPADLMRAVVPVFPPSESHLVREGSLKGERSPGELRCAPSQFFMLFDTNNDGLISFKEYIFFVTLLSVPESSYSVTFKMFDQDSNGEIEREEFKKVMALMRAHNRQGAYHRDGLRAGHKFSSLRENGGVVEYFFGEDGNRRLPHDKFVQFLKDLHEEMLRLEFSHYDYKSCGTISAKDFALSMVASADLTHLSKLIDRVYDLDHEPHISSIRITPEEFKSFAELRKKLQPFSLALYSFGQVNGLLTKNDFKRAASQVCGVYLTDNVIEIVFHVFDANRDGSLSADEFLRVLQKREKDVARPSESGIFSFLSCCQNCSKKSPISRLLFI